MASRRILIVGFGNPGRGDDGLGPALAARVEALGIPEVTVESDYQLAPEHAALAAEHEVVVFADAAIDLAALFYLRPVAPAPALPGFTSHGISPAEVLYLAQACFKSSPEGYLLGMRAHDIEGFREGLSPGAAQSLEAALEGLIGFIKTRRA